MESFAVGGGLGGSCSSGGTTSGDVGSSVGGGGGGSCRVGGGCGRSGRADGWHPSSPMDEAWLQRGSGREPQRRQSHVLGGAAAEGSAADCAVVWRCASGENARGCGRARSPSPFQAIMESVLSDPVETMPAA
eukprot:6198067-Pleurochrysis_carterae.AAC.1